ALALGLSCGGTGGSGGSAALPDAGSVSPDGGAASQDGGQTDAGSLPPDGGAPGQDAGQSDAGSDGGGEVLVPISAHFDSLSLSIFDPSGRLLSSSATVGGGSLGRDAIGVAD